MNVVHFFLISSSLLTCTVELQEFTLAHIDSQTRFLALFVVVDDSLEKRTLLFFSTSFSRVWISISEKLGLRFLVPDAMTRSKYCRYRYED